MSAEPSVAPNDSETSRTRPAMKPHRTIANRPMSVAACDVAWPSSGLQELPVGWFAPESEGDFWFVFTAPAYPSPSTSVRFCRIGHSCNLRCREPDYPRNRTNSRVNHPIRRCHTSRIGSQVHASRTSTARRRTHVAHDQIIQRHTEHVAKHQQLVTNVAFHATILRLHCDSQPNFATQPTVARREVGFTGLLRQ